jgi:hypothetical protein
MGNPAAVSTPVESLLPYLDKGGATLLAACIAAGVSLLGLGVSFRSARSQARLTSRLSDNISINKEARDYKLKQLTAFYDPLYTLLAANKNIFERIGPTSAIRSNDEFDSEETAEVWKRLSVEVIVPNNIRICEIIGENLHFISDSDNEALYLEFVTHAHAYTIFKDNAYGAYTLFQFPKGFFDSVKRSRDDVRISLHKMYLYPKQGK